MCGKAGGRVSRCAVSGPLGLFQSFKVSKCPTDGTDRRGGYGKTTRIVIKTNNNDNIIQQLARQIVLRSDRSTEGR